MGGVVPSNPFRQRRTFRAQPSQCMYTRNTISGGGGGGGGGSSGFFSSPPPCDGGLSCLSFLFNSGDFFSSSGFFSPSGFLFSWTNTKSVWARSGNNQENGYGMRRRERKRRDLSHCLWCWVSFFFLFKKKNLTDVWGFSFFFFLFSLSLWVNLELGWMYGGSGNWTS